MPTYEKCGDDVLVIVANYLKHHQSRTGFPEIKVGCVYYRASKNENDDTIGPPLKLHGYPAHAIIHVNSLKHRAQGLPDVEIVIDEDSWQTLSRSQQNALIDHELEHLEAVKKDNAPVSDDLGRPKLKLRLHDWHLEGFKAIAERHGADALEAKYANDFAVEYCQLLFPWAKPPPNPKEKARRIAESN